MNINQSKTQLRQRNESVLFTSPFSEAHSCLRPFYQVNLWAPIVLLMALTFVLSACSSYGANDLSGTAWELATLSGSDLRQGTAITLEFTDEEVSGLAGCNHYGGSYQVSGNSLTISNVFVTEMACPEPPGVLEQEGDYLAALNVAASYLLKGNQLEIRDEAGGVFLLFVKPAAASISQVDEPPEQPDESETVIIQNATPAPTMVLTLTAEVNEEPPLQTAESPLDFAPSENATEWTTLVSDDFPISLSYPADWQYMPNADNNQLNLPYVRGFSEPNETLVNQDGCAIHIGFGGGSGPTQTLTNDLVTIDGREFTKRTWYEGETPIFIAFLPSDIIPNFELLHAWVSQSNEIDCIQSIDAIIGSIEFTGIAGEG
jgi:heat shock protein HslJ